MSDFKFPFEIKYFNLPDSYFDYFNRFEKNKEIVKVGPKGYVFSDHYKQEASNIYNMKMRPTDIIVASYPRSGTTWTQELVWLVANDMDYDTAVRVPLVYRYSSIGQTILTKFLEKVHKSELLLKNFSDSRFFKTHMPFSLLPPSLIDNTKVVYIARNPRDVAVSMYHMGRLVKLIGEDQSFKPFWSFFYQNMMLWGPYFEHVKEAWELRHHPNMLFLFYEDLLTDLKSTVRRVTKFFNKEYTEQELNGLCEHLNFDNIKANKSVNICLGNEFRQFLSNNESFIRKGKAGGWRDYFDDEMTQQAEQWMADNLRDTDLCFPNIYVDNTNHI